MLLFFFKDQNDISVEDLRAGSSQPRKEPQGFKISFKQKLCFFRIFFFFFNLIPHLKYVPNKDQKNNKTIEEKNPAANKEPIQENPESKSHSIIYF